ncbi:DNA repair protein RecN [Coxiella burnetii]|uniref:DNA repair protein RecN n=1 Tax=Coxiella burnetii TaxID=777 RepID=UPI00223194DC|nr:DNA repair protein RecN [Coxiella burnetii]
MLTHIHIKNFIVVESLSLDFDKGLTVLTGETGAGKSIIVDAVNLALGERADTAIIRKEADQCDISLCFDISNNSDAQAWLKAKDFADGFDCIVRRIIFPDGRSRSTINGHPCTQQLIREFAHFILQIHGQHQHQTLLKRERQQQWLDNFAHHHELLDKIRQDYFQWKNLQTELNQLNEQAKNRDHELSLLRYQFEELENANLQEGEWKTLSQQHQQLHNAQSLIEKLTQAITLTVQSDEISASRLLQQAIERVNEIKMEDSQLAAIKEMLNTAAIYLQEAGTELNHYCERLDLSAENLTLLETRLSLIYDLARKHHISPDDLIDMKKSLQKRIEKLENIEEQIQSLKQRQVEIQTNYEKTASELSASRKKAAKTLEKKITEKMQLLGMSNGQFMVRFEKAETEISPQGKEKVTFYVNTNPGQEFLPLQKIVSGGELSRISLALQVITAQKENTSALIFDEVDTGIGGKTAGIVGQLLRELGEKAQVLCITHLPQVAALGHHHLYVKKIIGKNSVSTAIEQLTQKERVEELARMLSGTKITQQTIAHAESLLCGDSV